MSSDGKMLREMIQRQLPDVPPEWRLSVNDMKRICKYINSSIFDPEKCSIWNGYITNMNNNNKGTYINFYFKNKKVALHRLLYSNYVSPLTPTEYLKFNCDNKGICCNVNHYEKYKYSRVKRDIYKSEKKTKKTEDIQIGTDNPDDLVIDFGQ
jgi:hypothetical protein